MPSLRCPGALRLAREDTGEGSLETELVDTILDKLTGGGGGRKRSFIMAIPLMVITGSGGINLERNSSSDKSNSGLMEFLASLERRTDLVRGTNRDMERPGEMELEWRSMDAEELL